MGDPAGVGPEICLRILTETSLPEHVVPIIFGDANVLERCRQELQFPALPLIMECPPGNPALLSQRLRAMAHPAILHLPGVSAASITPGQMTAETGAASYAYIQAAIDAALRGDVAGVTTGPINKEALHKAGIPFPGHTEMFAARTQAPRSCMMQFAPEITCTFVTVHVGYAEVPRLLTVERILDVIDLTVDAMRRLVRPDPRLVVCGLNPHAGENGLFGDQEEERIIRPAIEQARAKGYLIEGPLPPDTAFVPAKRLQTDAFICMYHDQGHIPVKALAFDTAVNTTLGLPIIRTSVDHGTAGDIAWKGIARPGSMIAALKLAGRLATTRKSNQ